MRYFVTSALALLLAAPGFAQEAEVELWRLDCGRIEVRDLNMFSDNMAYPGQSKTLTDSCYLIRHGADYMLWDSGLSASFLGAEIDPDAVSAMTLDRLIRDQLTQIGIAPDQIGRIGISHNHFDHMGQAADFEGARLLIGTEDWAGLQADPPAFGVDPALARPWLEGGEVQPVSGDLDVFGDGRVIMLAAPGHTQGETALLIHLAETGPVLLSGDVVHFRAQWEIDGVPGFNVSRADSLASMDRLRDLIGHTEALLIIQHEAKDIDKLPAFPASAR